MPITAIPSLERSLPDGPTTSPAWQMLQWIGSPIEFMESVAQRYGDSFTLRFGGLGPFVFFSHPQAIQDIFTADPKQLDSGSSNHLLKPLLGDTSLILLDGDRHQRQRQLLMPPFHGERMRAYGNLMTDITQQVAAQWTVGQSFKVRTAMQNISLQVILQAVFGVTDPQRCTELRQLLSKISDSIGSPISSSLLFIPTLQKDLGPLSPWGKFVRWRSRINQLLYAEIAERRAHADPSRTDILSLMLSARDEAGEGMSDVELRDELMTLLLAGHETTASALSWALYWIHRSPSVLAQLKTELSTWTNPEDAKTLMRLPYLSAVCDETLRIYPIAAAVFPRIVKYPITVMSRNFEPGARLTPCIYLTHHRPELYPDPSTFRPERFLERQFSPYEFIAFGGGDRRCLGMAFAMFELKQVLATLLTHCQFELLDQLPLKPVRRGVTLAPPPSLKLQLVKTLP